MKVGFIGVGKLGKEVAQTMSEKHDVLGYDILSVDVDGVKMTKDIREVCFNSELIFIAVPTPHDPDYDGRFPTSHLPTKDFNYNIVKQVLGEINNHTNKNQLVVLISTVLPGTIRREFIPIVKNYKFIYNPYLIAMGTVKYDLINPEMVIIGTEDGEITGDASILINFYKTFVKEDTRFEIGTWDEAEAIKIFYNTFISTKVALVNMIQDVAEKSGNMNVDVVTGALQRSTKRIISECYMKAGMGDGGGCHPRDNIALRDLSKRLGLGYDLFDAIMLAREKQAENLADKLIELSQKYSLPIIVLGKTYKPDVPYEEGSTTILTSYYIKQKNIDVQFDVNPLIKGVYLIGHRNKFNDYNFPNGSIVLDVWREYKSKTKDVKVVYYGNTRKTN